MSRSPSFTRPAGSRLLTIQEAADIMGVSYHTIRRLVDDAYANKKSAWRIGREIIDLTPSTSKLRTIRIDPQAVAPAVAELVDPPGSDQSLLTPS